MCNYRNRSILYPNFGAYLSPVFDFGLGYVLDGHLKAISIPHPGVDDAKAALAQDVAHLVGLLKGLSVGRRETKVAQGSVNCKWKSRVTRGQK